MFTPFAIGDFEEIYGAQENDPRGHESQVGKWDAILTCFFIDTVKQHALLFTWNLISLVKGQKYH